MLTIQCGRYSLLYKRMKPMLVLVLILLTIDSSISDDLAETMQQSWSHGQITLTGEYVTSARRYRYRQQFLAISDNETVSIEVNYPLFSFSTLIQCQICLTRQDQNSTESCESREKCEDYLRQIWLNYECNCLPLQTSPTPPRDTHTYSKPATAGPLASANYIQISVAAFSTMVGLQIILLAVVSIGWIWTCWMIKKRERRYSTHISSSEKDIAMTNFLPSTNYSLLHPNNENGETLLARVDGEDKQCTCALGRGNGGMWTKKNQGKVPEGYSKLCHKTA